MKDDICVAQSNKDPKKYVFEYYCVSQLSTNFEYENLLGPNKGKSIFELDSFALHSNPLAQQEEMPSVLKNLNKWCFPEGLKVIYKDDSKFPQLSEFYRNPSAKISSSIHEINYFVLTDFASSQRFYCTAAYFYEKIVLIETNQQVVEVFVPRSHILISKAPYFNAQKNLIGYLLQVHRARESGEEGRVVQVEKEGKTYGIEQWKLFEFYIQFAFNQSMIEESNEKVVMRLHPSHTTIQFTTRNRVDNRFAAIATPSNMYFDSVMFSHSPYNLLQLITALILETQVLLVSSRSNSLSLFAENLVQLLLPMKWMGVYIPNMASKGMFDFEQSSLPFLIGVKRQFFKLVILDTEKWRKRERSIRIIVYDVDDNQFLYVSNHDKCELPVEIRSYFMNKINNVIGDVKFYEEDYYDEGVLRYKQAFYNLMLLTFHGIFKYIERVYSDYTDQDAAIVTSSSVVGGGIGLVNKNSKTNLPSAIVITQNEIYSSDVLNLGVLPDKPSAQKPVLSFQFDTYIESFSPDCRYFYEHATMTKMFSKLIEDVYHAASNPRSFTEARKSAEIDFIFGSVLAFVSDSEQIEHQGNGNLMEQSSSSSGLAVSSYSLASSTERRSEKRMNAAIEDAQNEIIHAAVKNKQERIVLADDFVADYLEGLFAIEEGGNEVANNDGGGGGGENMLKQPTQERLPSSCFISSFLNSVIDLQKEVMLTGGGGGALGGTRGKRGMSSQFTPKMDALFKDEDDNITIGFESKERFYRHYLERKSGHQSSYSSSALKTNGRKANNNNNTKKLFSDFNEDMWKIYTSEDVLLELGNKTLQTISSSSQGTNSINKKVIRGLTLFEKKDRLCRYQEQDEEEYFRNGDKAGRVRSNNMNDGMLSTVVEVTSAYSGIPTQKHAARKNSLKEFVQINNQMHPQMMILDQNNNFEKIEDLLFCQIDK